MAQKRMFDRSIIDTDKFMDMPLTAKALYFLLGLEADDYGFVSPKRVMKLHNNTIDDLKILIAKEYVIEFESGVVVITDWQKNNWLDKRRIRPTEYVAEYKMLTTFNNRYIQQSAKRVLSIGSESIEEYSIEEKSIEEYSVVAQPPKQKYGKFQNVYLNKQEYENLLTDYGKTKTKEYVEKLGKFIKDKNIKYNKFNHYKKIVEWLKEDVVNVKASGKIKRFENIQEMYD